MKHSILIAALVPISSPVNPLWAAPQSPLSQESALQEMANPVIPQALDPGALAALGEALLIDEPGDGKTWARGPQWKASFGPEGFTYIPFFGSDAPQNYPVQFDLVSASIAGESVELLARNRVRNGQTVSLERGALQEVYLLTKDTVEQTFVFDSLSSRGEIVLNVALDTELTAIESSDGGFTFYNDLGQVQYSQAVAVDALGNQLKLRQQLTETGLQITVPADFVRTAALPLVVDPILNTIAVTGNTRRQIDVDVAYEHNNTTYQIVYAQLQSALDSDILTANYNATLDISFPAASLDISSSYWAMPRNASCFHEEQFLCVSLVGFSANNKRVWGRTRHAGSGVRGPQFQISGIGAEHVDVGGKGNNLASNYDYMVVWQEVDSLNQDFDIVAQTVRAQSTLSQGRIIIDGDVGDLDRKPSISKSSGQPSLGSIHHEYMIVWEREISPTNRNIRAQVIEYTGSIKIHDQFNAYTFSDSLNPDVSSVSRYRTYNSEPYWVVVFERLVGSDYDIFSVIARDGNADNARNINAMQNLDLDLDHRGPAVVHDGQDFVVAYHSEDASGDRRVHLTYANVVHDNGELRTGLAVRRETLALSEGASPKIGITARYDGGGPFGGAGDDDVLAVWTARAASSNQTDVAGAMMSDGLNTVSGSQYCAAAINSTGASAWMTATGSGWLPGPPVLLRCSEMPVNVFGHYIVSNQRGFVPNPGGSMGNLCLQGAIGRYNQSGKFCLADRLARFHFRLAFFPSPRHLERSPACRAKPGNTSAGSGTTVRAPTSRMRWESPLNKWIDLSVGAELNGSLRREPRR